MLFPLAFPCEVASTAGGLGTLVPAEESILLGKEETNNCKTNTSNNIEIHKVVDQMRTQQNQQQCHAAKMKTNIQL